MLIAAMSKKTTWFLCGVALSGVNMSAQKTLANWQFETGSVFINPEDNPSPSGGFLDANVGIATATALHASGSTRWFIPSGIGLNKGSAATASAIGDYNWCLTSRAGFSSITGTWDQNSLSEEPRDFSFFHSTDGTNFTRAAFSLGEQSAAWNTTISQLAAPANLAFALSDVSALANSGAVYFRLSSSSRIVINGESIGSFSYGASDNISVGDNNIPEPATLATWLATVTVFSTIAIRRRRRTAIRTSSR